jgi:hypothetical protein
MHKLFRNISSIVLFLPVLLSLGGCPCGFDCSDSDDDDGGSGPASLTLGFSDANIDDITRVVIEVDSIIFRIGGADDVVVDTFTIDGLEQDSFQIDLLEYRGRKQFIVIEDLELAAGSYNELLITILEDDLNYSFVEESDGSLKVLNEPDGGLSLPGPVLSSGDHAYTVEFSLAQSIQYQSADDSYLLASDGVRVEDNAVAASLSGRVDNQLFDTVSPCDAKSDPEMGNRIYIYSGINLAVDQLADVHTGDSSNTIPDTAVAPFAVTALVENQLTGAWDYAFGYLPPGDYTLAFSCNAAGDDPVDFDSISVPVPAEQVYEINLSDAEQAVCDLEEGASC